MVSRTLISSFLFNLWAYGSPIIGQTSTSSQDRVRSQSRLDKEIDYLAKSVTIDKDNPPFYDAIDTNPDGLGLGIFNALEEPCPSRFNFFSCARLHFFARRTMIPESAKVSINYTTAEGKAIINNSGVDGNYKYELASAEIKSTTTGWTVGSDYSSESGFKISAAYRNEYTSTEAITETQGDIFPCRPGRKCSVNTVAFYATIDGMCQANPSIACAGVFREDDLEGFGDACTRTGRFFSGITPEEDCQQMTDFTTRFCGDNRPKPVPCSISFPLYSGGKPYAAWVQTDDTQPVPNAEFSAGGPFAAIQGKSSKNGKREEPELSPLDAIIIGWPFNNAVTLDS
ncbi:hypothetical protein DCS_03599 [Drechmeria coniospora]|uniref:Uncharacterized protein n=1 Tax=Drechmeria coniospora TaxID=98403 RepID=A0A151GHP6_DRECN|nr:hypothetical protein DCS_03599 [Drechmeria coniospora]KAH8836236.1 hypothetical protein RJ55_10061 [Drechmeria coniospora]KYK56598.1 hypothetical protein DCS_03599 [Drechmeria coniospora]